VYIRRVRVWSALRTKFRLEGILLARTFYARLTSGWGSIKSRTGTCCEVAAPTPVNSTRSSGHDRAMAQRPARRRPSCEATRASKMSHRAMIARRATQRRTHRIGKRSGVAGSSSRRGTSRQRATTLRSQGPVVNRISLQSALPPRGAPGGY
jgi:hypothetical protein